MLCLISDLEELNLYSQVELFIFYIAFYLNQN